MPSRSGLSLGYGMEFGLPTGASHGHGEVQESDEHAAGEEHEEGHAAGEGDENVYQFTPLLNAGLAAGPWELVAWTRYAIPTNQAEPPDRGPELRFDLSVLLHATRHIEPVLEMNGTVGLGGPQAERETLTVSPGRRGRPVADRPLVVGSSVSVPLTTERAFDARVRVSAFWHFGEGRRTAGPDRDPVQVQLDSKLRWVSEPRTGIGSVLPCTRHA